jgi:Domain of unknown function (DUF4908)
MSDGPNQGFRGAAMVAAALALSAPGLALAQDQSGPPVQGFYTASAGATRYSTPDAVGFVFDRGSGGRVALLRFDGDPEVHVLRLYLAAGGGEIYRNDEGDLALRVGANGAITVYTRRYSTGAPASEGARVAPLTPEQIAVAEMERRFHELEARARRNVGRTVTFVLPPRVPPGAGGIVIDAAERAAQGLAAAPLTDVRRVVISLGPNPALARRGDTLFIQVAPHLGYAGRPSSITVRNVVTGQVQGPEQ